jgi:hypothetical protein
MSHVPGEHSLDPTQHFESGMKDLLRFDGVRVMNILGSVQYGLLYAIVFFFVGLAIERLFPPFRSNASLHALAGEVLLQCVAVTVAIFYVRKLVEAIPGLATLLPLPTWLWNPVELEQKGWVPYGIEEYKGEIMMSLILIGTQLNLLKKIALLAARVGGNGVRA